MLIDGVRISVRIKVGHGQGEGEDEGKGAKGREEGGKRSREVSVRVRG